MTQSTIETHATYEIEAGESASRSVVEAVADVEGVDPIDLDVPLYDAIDPDALDTFYRSTVANDADDVSSVEFSYYGHDVTIDASGSLTVSE